MLPGKGCGCTQDYWIKPTNTGQSFIAFLNEYRLNAAAEALQMGEVEGAMSGLSIAVAGVLTAVLCPVFVGFIQ